MNQIFLSRRNLLTLLSKLDRQAEGDLTACTLIKSDAGNSRFPQTVSPIAVTAVEDEVYYFDREAGGVHPADTPK